MNKLTILTVLTLALTGCHKPPPPMQTSYGFEDFSFTKQSSGQWKGEVGVDYDVKHEGKRSIRITTTSTKQPNAFYVVSVPIAGAGKKLTFWAKTRDNTSVFATTEQSWNQRQLLAFKTTDWQKYEMDCLENGVCFVAEGQGTVWIDDIEVKE